MEKARRNHRLEQQMIQPVLSGFALLRGIPGSGANSRIHAGRILRISENLPIVIGIVDQKDRIDDFSPARDKPMNVPTTLIDIIDKHKN